eukprot:COSAG06_NODE_87_length_24962_cov_107.553795_28_plen_140_part_00
MRPTQLRIAIVSYVYSREWQPPPPNKWLEEICVSFYGLDFHSADIYPLSIFAYPRVEDCAYRTALSWRWPRLLSASPRFSHQRPGFWSLGPRHDQRRLEELQLRSVRIDVRVIVRRSAETSKALKAALPVASEAALLLG